MDPSLPPVLRVADVRAIEKSAHAAPLMERAGAAASAVASELAGERCGSVVILAGPGNNGGDGLVVARLLRESYYDVTVVFRDEADQLPADAADAWKRLAAQGGHTATDPPSTRPALIVDALFGIGLARKLAARHAHLVEWANASGAPILALDVPTGLNADTGIAAAPAIRARATATFFALKPGMLTGSGPELCGEVSVHPLDVAFDAAGSQGHLLRWPLVAAQLPETLHRRARNVHKGTFGTLAIVGGAQGMLGAALLAARAGMRLGAGKVLVGFAAADHPAVDFTSPELMLRSADDVFGEVDAMVIGPGLGTGDTARALVARAIASAWPLLLDADALNLAAAHPSLREALRVREGATILTPHPAEAARLLGTDVAGVQRDRLGAAHALARACNAHVVIKGAGSVLAHPDGSFDINASGNPALAAAGTGDVLSGMTGALLAQRIDATTALRIAVCAHGAAADSLTARGVGPMGVPASMFADEARDLINAAR